MEQNGIKKWVVLGSCIIVVILLSIFSIRIVPAGHRGVLLRWGAVQNNVLGEGLWFICPIRDTVRKIDVQTQKHEIKASAFSKDLQTAETIIAINYHVSPTQANKIWQEIGVDYQSRIIDPAIQEIVKAVTAKFNAQMLVEQREQVKKEMQEFLTVRLQQRYLIIDELSIVNFDFSDEYEKAIEAKQVAQQQVLTSANVLQQRKYEARQRIATATGEAEAIRIQAEAVSKVGGEAYIMIRAIDKWNGQMPQILAGGDNKLLFNIPTTK